MNAKSLSIFLLLIFVIDIKSVKGMWLQNNAKWMSQWFGNEVSDDAAPAHNLFGPYGKDQGVQDSDQDLPLASTELQNLGWFKKGNIPPPANWLHPHVYKKGADSQHRTALTNEKREKKEGGHNAAVEEWVKDGKYINDLSASSINHRLFKWAKGKRRVSK